MNANVEHAQDDNYHDGHEAYTIFVTVDGNQTQLPLARLRGDNGPDAYGTGFTLTVRRSAATRA